MERTPFRDEFFAHVMQDPYGALMKRLWSDAWALGYEAAIEEVRGVLRGESCRAVLDELAHRKGGFRDLRERAMAELTDQQRKSEAEAIVALSMFGGTAPLDKAKMAADLERELGLPSRKPKGT